MSRSNQTVFDYSSLKVEVNKYFEKQLDDLGLSMSTLKRQSEESLRRNLIVVQHAMENHESFGKFAIRLSAEAAIVVSTKRESHFEIGILPLLLERYQLILKRLDDFDKKKKISRDNSQARISDMRAELTRIAQSEVNRWLWFAIGGMVTIFVVMFFLVENFGWNVLEPWTFLLGLAMAIGGYVYFAIKQREFSPLTIYRHALETRRKALFQIFGVQE